jgi:transcriptional regulator with XRE-family HTH domain
MQREHNENFGTKLREIRKSLGMTQEELADVLNTTQSSISKYEKGAEEPNLTFLRELRRLSGKSLDEIVSD